MSDFAQLLHAVPHTSGDQSLVGEADAFCYTCLLYSIGAPDRGADESNGVDYLSWFVNPGEVDDIPRDLPDRTQFGYAGAWAHATGSGQMLKGYPRANGTWVIAVLRFYSEPRLDMLRADDDDEMRAVCSAIIDEWREVGWTVIPYLPGTLSEAGTRMPKAAVHSSDPFTAPLVTDLDCERAA